MSSSGGSVCRSTCHTQRLRSQHDSMLSSMLHASHSAHLLLLRKVVLFLGLISSYLHTLERRAGKLLKVLTSMPASQIARHLLQGMRLVAAARM